MSTREEDASIVVERSIEIDRDAASTWAAIRAIEGLLVAHPIFDGVTTERHDDGRIEQHIRLGPQVEFRTRIESIDDAAMMVRSRMTEGTNVPWTEYAAIISIAANGDGRSRIDVHIECTPLPGTGDTVHAMLRDSIDFALPAAKERLEAGE